MRTRKSFNRSQILDRDGHQCEECGSTEELEIHHKDGDRSNDDPSNAQILCRECHMQVHINLRYQANFQVTKLEYDALEIAAWRLDSQGSQKTGIPLELLARKYLTDDEFNQILATTAQEFDIGPEFLQERIRRS